MFSETSVYRKLPVAQPDNRRLSGLVVSVALLKVCALSGHNSYKS